MATTGVVTLDEPRLADFEVRGWEKAKAELAKTYDPEKVKEFLKTRTTIQDTQKSCQDMEKLASQQYKNVVGKIIAKLDMCMKIGDLAAKASSETVGLAWTGVRLCFHSFQDDFETFSLFSGACLDIVGILISCRAYGRLLSAQKGPEGFPEVDKQVMDAIPGIYYQIVEFSYKMWKEMKTEKIFRIAKGLLKSNSSTYKDMINKIKDSERQMSDFAQRAVDQLVIYKLDIDQNTLQEVKELIKSNGDLQQKINDELQRLKNKTPQDVAQDNLNANRQGLNASYPLKTILEKRIPLPGTCLWIFDKEKTKEYEILWNQAEGSRLLWISGEGGFGKSFLIVKVIQTLRDQVSHRNDTVLCYFLCNRGNAISRSTRRVLDHLIAQLYEHAASQKNLDILDRANTAVASYLQKLRSDSVADPKGQSGQTANEKNSESLAAYAFEDAFLTIVEALKKQVYIVIDALDECDDREEQGFLSLIKRLVKSTAAALKILICSRREGDINPLLAVDEVIQIRVEDKNGPDVERFTNDHLSRLAGWTKSERALASERIVKKAGPWFKYVDLVVDILRQPFQRPVSKKLDELPQGLTDMYVEVFHQIDPSYGRFMETFLTWVILSPKTLTVTEIVDAYSEIYSEGNQDEDVEELTSVQNEMPYRDQIVKVGAAFLKVDWNTGMVDVSHETVKEAFLRSDNNITHETKEETPVCPACGLPKAHNGRWTLTRKEGHLAITRTIFRHLNSDLFCEAYLPGFTRPSPANADDSSDSSANDQSKSAEDTEDEPQEKPTAEPEAEDSVAGIEDDAAPEGTSENVQEDLNTVDPTKNDELEHSDGVALDSEQIEPSSPGSRGTSQTNGSNHSLADKATSEVSKEGNDTELHETNVSTLPDHEIEDEEDISEADSDMSSKGSPGNANPPSASTDNSLRYEITNCLYHLQKVFDLWPETEQTGVQWIQLWNDILLFFDQDGSPRYESWLYQDATRQGSLFEQFGPSSVVPIHVASAYGLTALAKRLIVSKEDVRRTTLWGQQPLHYAARLPSGQQKRTMCELLFKNSADANFQYDDEDTGAETPFHVLLSVDPTFDSVQLFLHNGAKCSVRSRRRGWFAVHYFATFGTDIKVLEALIAHGADINAQDTDGETPLHKLVRRPDLQPALLRSFIREGAVTDQNDKASQKPLFEVASSNNKEALEIILSKNPPVNDEDEDGMTALHNAALHGFLEGVKMLIDKGADPTQLDSQDRSPFYLACQSGDAKTVEYLARVLTETDLNKSNWKIKPPLSKNILDTPTKNGKTPLRKAVAMGHTSVIQVLLERFHNFLNIDYQDPSANRTVLHIAARLCLPAVVRLLLDHSARTDLKDKAEDTPLTLCYQAWVGNISADMESVVLFLINHNEETRRAALMDEDLLNAAVICGSEVVVETLLKLGVDVTRRDEHGWTALELARQYNNKEIQRMLSREGITVGKPPSGWVQTKGSNRLVNIFDDGLELQWLDGGVVGNNGCSFLSDHPIPAGAGKYYFEIKIHEPGEGKEKSDAVVVGVGLCHRRKKLMDWFPGLPDMAQFGQLSWGYHGDDGSFHEHLEGCRYDLDWFPYGQGATVGCAIDFLKAEIFYTLNGKRLMKTTFTNVKGRLYPAVGISDSVEIRTNFGKEPFLWEHGNNLDFDADIPSDGAEEDAN
ncbi:hypothetical protein AOQ84DRAFT_374597 [Glonium stellatum]|uniref:B30.2/SPRY domain-containing protein n=1 Tax=Glonium stellatum TaxID=574774 RepID=A0A8E2JVK8_9PEZI|nr:hypothetical protein AOQ84DRAFT_374597 [Glonium stellatum]